MTKNNYHTKNMAQPIRKLNKIIFMKKALVLFSYTLIGGIVGFSIYLIMGALKILFFLTGEVGFDLKDIVILLHSLIIIGAITGFFIGKRKIKK